eukprot:scaffold32236_cov26-Tisochrysis_lutea.AAC.1
MPQVELYAYLRAGAQTYITPIHYIDRVWEMRDQTRARGERGATASAHKHSLVLKQLFVDIQCNLYVMLAHVVA